MTITVTAFVLALVAGIIAIILGITKENAPAASTFWWWIVVWIAVLSLLWPGAVVLR